MKLTGYEANAVVLKEIGTRIKNTRIDSNITQARMADITGLSVKTISNIENGHDTNLSAFISCLRVLGLLGNIELLLPEYVPNAEDLLNDRKRKRASTKKMKNDWKWGDEE